MLVNITTDNLYDTIKAGDIIVGAEDLGVVVSVRVTRDGFDNALVVGESGRDVLGLPSTIEVQRAA